MGKRDHIKRVFKDFSKKSSASESASTTLSTALEPRLNEPTERVYGAPVTGNRSQDAPVRDLWSLALENLSEEDKYAVSRIKSDSKLDILRHLRTAAVKKQADCEDRRWKFELNGQQIILRDIAEKIIIWIDRFKEIGDIAVNFDPVHASLPWAGIRFLLEITVAESQQMGALLTGVEKMTPLIGRCQIYETLYLRKEQFDQEEWKLAKTNLTSALVALYATMLSFLASAIRSYNQGIVSRTLSAVLNPAELVGFLDKCQPLENNLAIEVAICERIHTRRIQASSEEQIQKLKRMLVDLQAPTLRTDSRIAALCEKLDNSERQNILEWISSIRYEENHSFARLGRTNRTGEWLLRHERYCKWRVSSASTILWLHGDPGSGKTKLVSTVVDDLLETFAKLPNDEAFAYFYCDRNQSERREPALILSSFVRQLSVSRDSDAIPHPTIKMYKQKQRTAFASGTLKLDESQTILAELFQIYPQITLVVDALDECDKNTRTGFIDILDKMIAESSKPVKILISSRRDRDIKHRFEGGPNLEIRAIDNQDDIATFVKHEIAIKNFWQDELSLELKELICNTLVEKSGGMFQWAALQIAALRELCLERDIRNRLGKLPETLKMAYDELYHKIQSQKESTPMIANRAFQWVACSCRPLSPAELVAAVCQDPDTNDIDKIDVSINVILGACQNLLVVDPEQNVCRFSHLSVQEYFESYHWSSCETDCLVGKVCLSFLNYSAAQKQDAHPMKKEGRGNRAYDILNYACLNWTTHVQRLEENEIVDNRLTALLKYFLGSMDQSSLAYQNWHEMVGWCISKSVRRHYSELPLLYQVYGRLSPCSRASLAIVTFGFHKTILDWWTVGFADVNEKNSQGDSLLLLGARGDSFSIVDDLLKKGAEVNTLSEGLVSALQIASAVGHESIVQLLLNNGADINALCGDNGSALQEASDAGHEPVVQLLLDKGADVNASGGLYGPALGVASKLGHESIVLLLLNKGADVNASGGHYGNALQGASFFGFGSIVQLLLDKGANVNASGGFYGSALQAASLLGHESVVRLLLNKGADVNASGGVHRSALHAALVVNQLSSSNFSRRSIVQLLLNKGADVNAPSEDGGQPLQTASYSGLESLVQMLLDHGADVNASGGECGSALQAAAYSRHPSIVRLLLSKGADVHASGGNYGSALKIASFDGCEAVVQLLQTAMKSQ